MALSRRDIERPEMKMMMMIMVIVCDREMGDGQSGS